MPVVRYVHEAQLEDYLQKQESIGWLFNSFFLVVAFALFLINIQIGSFRKQTAVVINSGGKAEVEGVSTEAFLPTPTITPTPTPTDLIYPTSEPVRVPKSSYKIAVFGDSMIDTMGERLEYLGGALKTKYPLTTFDLYNYGIGAENAEEGINRFGKEFHYKDRNFPPLSALHPDIIIIGSFGYNPFSPYDRNKHWLTLARLIEEVKHTNAQIYVLAEIAPLVHDFGRGPNGVDWPDDLRSTHAHQIIEQLENAVGLAKNEQVGLIDVFDQTVTNSQKEGRRQYVNPGDGIHPSVEGHEFTAEQIVKTLQFR